MNNRLIIDEILALSQVRVQKIDLLLSSMLVFELYSPQFKRLYLVIDQNHSTQSIHIQPQRPNGIKTKSNFLSLINKYIVNHWVKFVTNSEDNSTIKMIFTVDSESFCLLITWFQKILVGFYRNDKLLESLSREAPVYSAGFLVSKHAATDLQHNFSHALWHETAWKQFHQSAVVDEHKSRLKAALAKKKKLEKNVQQDRQRAERALEREHEAILLSSHLHLYQRGMKEIEVMDYEKDPPQPRKIVLDPKYSPQEFLTKIFHHVKRAKRGLPVIDARLESIRTEIKNLEHQSTLSLDEDANFFVTQRKEKKKSSQRVPFRSYHSSDGITILVGKSAKDSDALLRIAKGNEWWFHARDVQGAHVLARTSVDALPQQTLIEAGLLAQYFSNARAQDKAEISYTRAKYVQKKKGLAVGKVILSQEKTIDIRFDDHMLRELLEQEEKY